MEINKQHVAVITGAGSGIGKALAHACADAGARIIAADIEIEAAQKTVDELHQKDTDATAVHVDVANASSMAALAEKTWDTYGACHLLFNNAGVSINRPLAECTEADWNWVLSVNVMGVANAISSFVPTMKKQQGSAHIVNTASMAGLIPLPEFGPYVASKYAVVGLSEVLQLELAEFDIGVSILCPGVVDTRIFESHRNRHDSTALSEDLQTTEDQGSGKQNMDTDFEAAFTRMLNPEDVAAITLNAVRNNSLYVPTHPEWLPLVTQRSESITKAF